jgi:hypothetical protein
MKVEDCLSRHDVPFVKIGTTGGQCLKISYSTNTLMDIPVDILDHTWRNALSEWLEA